MEQWAATTLPRWAGRCVARVDVLDERAASVERGGGGRDHGEALPHPQRTSTDDAARAWVTAALP